MREQEQEWGKTCLTIHRERCELWKSCPYLFHVAPRSAAPFNQVKTTDQTFSSVARLCIEAVRLQVSLLSSFALYWGALFTLCCRETCLVALRMPWRFCVDRARHSSIGALLMSFSSSFKTAASASLRALWPCARTSSFRPSAFDWAILRTAALNFFLCRQRLVRYLNLGSICFMPDKCISTHWPRNQKVVDKTVDKKYLTKLQNFKACQQLVRIT